MFAAIYHPVGLAIVVAKWKNTGMRLAVNGVWGNLGVASAALITGYLIYNGGWRIAFIVPGVFSTLVGLAYAMLRRRELAAEIAKPIPVQAAGAGRDAAELQGSDSVARLRYRVRDDGDFEHRVPIHDLRLAEDFRRAAAGCRGESGRRTSRCRIPSPRRSRR